ncbi:MAG: hypothetical protein Q8K37_05700 [Alphaproteobacteria bacterium]|nr:hypothetical protein [Alphaproteobacteria bacterium]
MKKNVLFFSVGLLMICSILAEAINLPKDTDKQITKKLDADWLVGAKIHFAEDNGADYLGIKEINKIAKTILKSLLNIHEDSGSDNAKILLKKEGDKIKMTHYEEKSIPGIGEEMHASLLYTGPRGFHDSETLHQVCNVLFKNCQSPPNIESVAKEYSDIIKSDWKFQLSKIVLTKSDNGPSFIMAKLLWDGRENIYKSDKPISAGLHMTLVNCADSSILQDSTISNQLIEKLNAALKGKMIKMASKNGVVDLEFGKSGMPWRIRAGEKIEIKR